MTKAIDGRSLVAALGPDDRSVILPVVVSGGGPGDVARSKKPIERDDLIRIVEGLCFRRL